jgi:hypothetical protein
MAEFTWHERLEPVVEDAGAGNRIVLIYFWAPG